MPLITGPNGMGMVNLNSLVNLPPGVTLTQAAVNNNGQVVAMGMVPELETYALMLVGLGLVGFMVRRKKGSEQQVALLISVISLIFQEKAVRARRGKNGFSQLPVQING